jgi:hypothetical protein
MKYKKLKIDTLNKLAILKIQEFEGKKYKQFYKKTFKKILKTIEPNESM